MGRKKAPGDRHQDFGPTPKTQFGALGKQLASLAGLASIDRQSVQWHGKSFIQGGRKPVRDALYMPALVAIRWNPDLKAEYDQLRATGKPAKLVIVAIMRKLVEMANPLVKANRKWVPKIA